MLDPTLVPTPLLDRTARPPVVLVEPEKPSSFRVLSTVGRLGLWLAGVAWSRIRGERSHEDKARRFRAFVERMGGVWIKAGQILSLRRDVFGDAFAFEMAKLQDQAYGFPAAQARQILEASLGRPVEECFDVFEEVPLAAASIGQTHRARLAKEGVWVAVKIQRPHAAEIFQRDLATLAAIARFMHRHSILPHLHWTDFIEELEVVLSEELDYRIEASSIRRMRKTLRRHGVYVPRTFSRYSTRQVLVMEFVEGVFMSEYTQVLQRDPDRLARWLAENDIDPVRVGERLYFSLLRQFFEDNLFHGDLHPGNIVLLKHGKVALIDFGTIGSMESEYQRKYLLFVKSIADRAYSRAVDILFLLTPSLPAINLEQLKTDLVRSLRAWETRALTPDIPYHEKSLANGMGELARILHRYQVTMEWAFLRIDRTHLTLDASLVYLFPQIQYPRLLARFFRKFHRRTLRRATQARVVQRGLAGFLAAAIELPERWNDQTLLQEAVIRRSVRVFQGTTTKAAHLFEVFFGRLSFASMALLVGLLVAALHQHHPGALDGLLGERLGALDAVVPRMGGWAWAGLIAIACFAWRTFADLRHRFGQKEFRPADRQGIL